MNFSHTFVICAYKESPYLEECIKSLQAQTLKSQMIMVTSTPCEFLDEISRRYQIPLIVNPGPGGIVEDWNFGYHQVKTPYLTLAHQDDLYYEGYTEHFCQGVQRARKKALIFFSDYVEIRQGQVVKENKLLKIKRLMLLPLRPKIFSSNRFIRRRILSFGSPICCPSVGYARENLPETIFSRGFISNQDWEAWERLSKLKGDFLYDPEALVAHRIHEASTTTEIISEHGRSKEDAIMYRKFWPKWIANLLVRAYAKGQDSNQL